METYCDCDACRGGHMPCVYYPCMVYMDVCGACRWMYGRMDGWDARTNRPTDRWSNKQWPFWLESRVALTLRQQCTTRGHKGILFWRAVQAVDACTGLFEASHAGDTPLPFWKIAEPEVLGVRASIAKDYWPQMPHDSRTEPDSSWGNVWHRDCSSGCGPLERHTFFGPARNAAMASPFHFAIAEELPAKTRFRENIWKSETYFSPTKICRLSKVPSWSSCCLGLNGGGQCFGQSISRCTSQ